MQTLLTDCWYSCEPQTVQSIAWSLCWLHDAVALIKAMKNYNQSRWFHIQNAC